MVKQKQKIKTKAPIFFFAAFFILAVFAAMKIKADSSNNVTGWMWGGSDTDGVQLSGDETGVGWISTNNTNTSGSVAYGLNIPPNGIISGYAWSENVGWISFNAADLAGCPDGNCTAKSNGQASPLTGWARILSISQNASNAGGWLGWIKLSGTAQNGSTYGVVPDSAGNLTGYAWSDELGAISFKTSLGGVTAGFPSISLSASPAIFALNPAQTFSTSSVTLSWVDSGNLGTCTASCVSGACDSAWTSAASAKLATSGSMNVQVSGTTQFKISCQNAASDATTTVSVGCYPKVCQNSTCGNSSTLLSGTSYNATCLPASTCSSNADCIPRSSGNWKEVAPQ